MNGKEVHEIYSDFLESDTETASEAVRSTYSAIGTAFEEYLCAVQEDMFRKAFSYGYAKGMEAAEMEVEKTV